MLTVLLATRNRAQILREVLDAFVKVQSPASGWKLVVIDNGSTDQTAQVIAAFAHRLPLQSVSEPELGKNFAVNRGLALAEGDLVVFTDDDAFPHTDWLVQLRKASDAHPEYAMFGGVIVPRWEVSPPDWVRWIDDPGPVYTITNPSWKEGPVDAVLVFGPNMAVRNGVFEAGASFDPCMGPRGTSYPMGSETELLVRLERQGYKAWHVQNAVVEHFIRKEQMEKSWVLQRAVRYGRGRFRMSLNVKLWKGIPRHLFRDIPREGMLIVAAWISFRQKALFQAQWRFNTLRGMASEARTMARERQAQSQSALEPVD